MLSQFYCGEEAKENLEGHSFMLVLDLWKERNKRSFEDAELLDQAIKYSFACWNGLRCTLITN